MKYLKYALGAIVVLLLIVVGRGLMTPSISYSSEVVVDKSVEEAWAVMNDESKISEWLTGITNVEHLSGEKGAVGAVTAYTFEQQGEENVVVETMKAIRPNEHVAMDFVMEDVMSMDYKVDFTEKDGKTHIKSSTIAKGMGIFMKSILPFMHGQMQSQEDENMGKLQKLINENTTDYFPAPEPVIETAMEATSEAVQEVVE